MDDADMTFHDDLRAQLKNADHHSLPDVLKEAVEHLLKHIERLEDRVAQLEGRSTSAPFPEAPGAPPANP